MTELELQLDDVIRVATEMRDTIAAHGRPDLADARILRGMAECAERLVELDHVKALRSATPAQDKASQRAMGDRHHARADELEAGGNQVPELAQAG
jgi:hypothetical protein